MVREERRGPGVRCLVVRGQGAPVCGTAPWAPHAILPTAGLPGRRRRSRVPVSNQANVALPNVTLLTSFPRCTCLGCSGRSWPCRLEELPCFPFKERLKRPCWASAACHGSASGDIAMVQTQERKEDRARGLIWSWQPSMADASLHGVRLPANVALCCPCSSWGRDRVPACTPRLRGSRGQVGRCSRHWQAGEGRWDGNPRWSSGVLVVVGAGSGHPIGVCSAVMQAAESQAG